MLTVENLQAGYGGMRVLFGISIDVRVGETVALLGANGAGKTTLIRALAGQLPSTGRIRLDGEDLTRLAPYRRARQGLRVVPEGRGTLGGLTVLDNLLAGGVRLTPKARRQSLDHWLSVYPRLAERASQPAWSLSGGEQQMLAIARAMMCRPRVLLLDEPSMGLAPILVKGLYDQLRQVQADYECAILVAEQNATQALKIASRGLVLKNGAVTAAASADELLHMPAVREAYLGM